MDAESAEAVDNAFMQVVGFQEDLRKLSESKKSTSFSKLNRKSYQISCLEITMSNLDDWISKMMRDLYNAMSAFEGLRKLIAEQNPDAKYSDTISLRLESWLSVPPA